MSEVKVMYRDVTVNINGEENRFIEGMGGVKSTYVKRYNGVIEVAVVFDDDSVISHVGYPCIMRGEVDKAESNLS